MRTRIVTILFLTGIAVRIAFANDLAEGFLLKGREASTQGNYIEAERLYRSAVEASAHNARSANLGEAMTGLGGVLLVTGRFEESKGVCEKALEILRKSGPKGYLPVVLNHLSLLAHFDGDYPEAIRYEKQSLRVVEDLDPHDPYISRILNNLGAMYFSLHDNGQAEKTFKKAIAHLEKETGRDDVRLLSILANLGGVYVARKKWDLAETQLDRAMSLLQDHQSVSRADLASVLDNVGLLHYGRGRLRESEKALRESYAIRLTASGEKNVALASTGLSLAVTLAALGQYDEAEQLHRKTLAIFEKAYGPKSRQVADSLENTAVLFRKTNRNVEADDLQARADSIRYDLEHVVRANRLHE